MDMGNIGKGLMDKMSGDGGQNKLLGVVAHFISSSNIGGLNGLAQLFNQRGQGNAMASWISTGENQSISPEQVQNVLGQDHVREIADKAGMSEQDTSRGLSSVLPQLVDKLTPDGKLPDEGKASSTLSQLAGRFLGTR